MALFKVPQRAGKSADKAIASKSKNKSKAPTTVKGSSVLSQINQIKAMVEKNLGKYKDDYLIIQTEEKLTEYLTYCQIGHEISIDTETTGLDPILDKIVGAPFMIPLKFMKRSK